MRLGDAIDRSPGLSELAGGQREPGNEADAVGLAIGEDVLTGTVGEVVAVLHGGDREHLPRRFDLSDRHFGKPGMGNDALVEKLAHRAELLVARHFRIDAMQLPEIDPLDAEFGKTLLGLTDQIIRTAVGRPLVRAATGEATLGGDQQSLVGGESFADQLLGNVGAVAVGGIDEVDADLR